MREGDRMFDVDELVADCQAALTEDRPPLAIRDVLRRAIERPSAVGDVLRPATGGITLLHRADDLTVLHAVWAPGMRLFPHDHRMWAAIGIYAGQEDNAFYRRDGDGGGLVEAGGKECAEGDVLVLGDDVIHSVANPLQRLTAAIHIYGGDFVDQPRSLWGPGPEERPYDMAVVEQEFAKANEAWEAVRSTSGSDRA
jgi:predicted metal-dependent enzyme (double-stranded beta helix superfamily)